MPAISPRAYLARIRNVRRGLLTRTKIIELLSRGPSTTRRLAGGVGLTQSAVRKHLRNMAAEGIVEARKIKGRFLWRLTGAGQSTLEEAIS